MNNARALPALRAGRHRAEIQPAKLPVTKLPEKTAGWRFAPESD